MLLACATATAQTDSTRHEVLLETSMGNIRIALYNETPQHRDNFMRLVKEGFYDGVLFHRVIYGFMIQTGDSASRHAQPGQQLGGTAESHKVPAEIHYPELLHKRGAVAAAREPDEVNPRRESSASQFYIVYGKRMDDLMLDKVQAQLDKSTGGLIQMSPETRSLYYRVGGTPHLDGQYTVFGEVLEGLNIVNRIQCVETDANDRPTEDVRIVKATIVK